MQMCPSCAKGNDAKHVVDYMDRTNVVRKCKCPACVPPKK